LNVLRTELRRRRAALTAADVAAASRQIDRLLWRLPFMARCRSLACYLAVRQEVDCAPMMAAAWSRRRMVLLPMLHARQLAFAPYQRDMPMVRNRFGIPEPEAPGQHTYHGAEIDVVLVPLVGFDPHGNRLGMGAGYYDRTFRFLRHRRYWRRPRLVGIAYDFQCVDALPRRAWDVPLDVVVTDESVYECPAAGG
jgi:5-formyltetrahydrofolate cyclo-ligase